MQDEVQLHDKVFKKFITEAEIQQSIKSLVERIEHDYEGVDLLLLPVLNGSFMFASDLMKEMSKNVSVSFVKVSSYHGNMQTSGRVDELIGLNSSIVGKHVLIIEDIVDTGITIDKVLTLLRAHYPAGVEVCTMLYKPEAYEGKNPPKYVGIEIPNRFVVGYGLDYNEYGRNLKEIYQLKEE
jgi:hypoxanthine phosphoribosyltransferase